MANEFLSNKTQNFIAYVVMHVFFGMEYSPLATICGIGVQCGNQANSKDGNLQHEHSIWCKLS